MTIEELQQAIREVLGEYMIEDEELVQDLSAKIAQ